MEQGPQPTLEAWKTQLQHDVAPYISVARSRRHGVQVVLFVDNDGKVGTPKITVTTQAPKSGA